MDRTDLLTPLSGWVSGRTQKQNSTTSWTKLVSQLQVCQAEEETAGSEGSSKDSRQESGSLRMKVKQRAWSLPVCSLPWAENAHSTKSSPQSKISSAESEPARALTGVGPECRFWPVGDPEQVTADTQQLTDLPMHRPSVPLQGRMSSCGEV